MVCVVTGNDSTDPPVSVTLAPESSRHLEYTYQVGPTTTEMPLDMVPDGDRFNSTH